jgi:hypothetical protein
MSARPEQVMQPPDARAGSFNLRVDPASYLDGECAGGFSLELDDSDDGLVARVHVEDASNLRALYCDLEYDAAKYTPVDAKSTALLGVGDDVLKLAVLEDPGVVHLGVLKAHWDGCTGFSGDGAVAEVRFTREPFTASPNRSASSALASDAVKPYLFLSYSTRRLKWTYYYPGDYNQDGRVNLSDITPLGRHWGWRMYYEGDLPFERRLGYVIDGNRDNRITIQDMTEIGRRFGEGVEHFNIYSSAKPGRGYPATPDAPSSIAPLAEVPMATALGEAGTEPVYFEQLLPGLMEGHSYWVRPVFGGAEGTPSNAPLCDTTGLDSFSYGVQPETYLDDGQLGGLELDFGADGQELVVDVTMKGAVNLHYISADVVFDPGRLNFVGAFGADFEAPGSMLLDKIHPVGECAGRIVVSYHYLPGENGFSGDWNCFRLFFTREPQPKIAIRVGGFHWADEVNAQYNEITQLYTWYYANSGDMDQDSEVLPDDIIQLTRFIHQSSPEDFDSASAQYMADANNDGFININELTLVGQNYRCTVTGYNIYAATDPEDAPGGANWHYYPRPPVAPIGYVTLADDALGELFVDRLHFSFRIYNPEPGMWIWVQPKAWDEIGEIPEGAIVQIPK